MIETLEELFTQGANIHCLNGDPRNLTPIPEPQTRDDFALILQDEHVTEIVCRRPINEPG